MIGFCLLNKPFNLSNYISRWLMVTPLAFLHFTVIDSSSDFIKKLCIAFIKTMVILSILSLLFYIIGPLTGLIKYSNLVSIHWGGDKFVKSYYNVYFTMQFFYSKYFSLPRNSGIFTEAPMFALSLTIAFCLAIIRKEVNKKDIVILFLTIFSTISTTAIIIVSLMLVVRLFTYKTDNKMHIFIKRFVFPILAVALIIASAFILNIRLATSSYTARQDDFNASITSFKKSPIYGIGYGNEKVIIKNMSSNRRDKKGDYNIGISTSFGALLAECGILFLIFQIIGIIILCKMSLRKKEYNNILFYLVMTYLYLTTIFAYTPLLYILIAYTYNPLINGEKKEKTPIKKQ
jgi:hypothetical protein